MKIRLVTLVVAVVLTSCAPKNKTPSILSDQVCGKTCWNNITVGKTDKQELLETISTIPNVDQDSITIFDEPSGGLFDENIVFQYYRILGDQKSSVNISARANNQKIIFMIFQGDLGLTFKDVSDAFGEPDFVSTLWTFDGGINAHFVNSLRGTEITAYFKSEESSVSPDTEVNHFVLFDPNLYQSFLEADLFSPDDKSLILYPWIGYGKIKDYYWPPR